jgi:HK97 family phage prohead protease
MERFFAGSVEPLGPREVGVIAATSGLARDGHVIAVGGMDLSNYRKNPIVLWQHLPEQPIGVTTALSVVDGDLLARIAFAPEGMSATADQICSLTKAGILQGVSIGFDIQEATPLDPARGTRGGLHITRSELIDISVVSIPADSGAGVVQRALSHREVLTLFRSLTSISSEAIDRATARVSRGIGRTPWSHAAQVWMLCEGKRLDREADYSLAARQAEAAELRRRGDGWLNDMIPTRRRQRTDMQRKYCS